MNISIRKWGLLASVALIVSTAACDVSTENPLEGQDLTPTAERERARDEMLNNYAPGEKVTLTAGEGGSVTTESDVTIKVESGTFVDAEGNRVTGEVEVNLLAVFDRAGMVFAGMPTVTADGEVLESGGEFVIGAEQDGEPLDIDPEVGLTLEVPIDATIADPEGMLLYEAIYDAEGNFIGWEEVGPAPLNADGTAFSVTVFGVGGYNIDVPIEWPSPLTDTVFVWALNEAGDTLPVEGIRAELSLTDFATLIPLRADTAKGCFFTDRVSDGVNITALMLRNWNDTLYVGLHDTTTRFYEDRFDFPEVYYEDSVPHHEKFRFEFPVILRDTTEEGVVNTVVAI